MRFKCVDAKSVASEKFLLQKVNYIHLNAAKRNYKLAEDWRKYEHRKACCYEQSKVLNFALVHQMKIK
jgi:hypothetical protein